MPDAASGLACRGGLELLLEVVDHLVDDGVSRWGAVLADTARFTGDAGDEFGRPAEEFHAADELLHE